MLLNQDVSKVSYATLLMRKEKLREVKSPVQGHTAGNRQRDRKLPFPSRKPLGTR